MNDPADQNTLLIQQYTAYVNDLGNFGSRYETMKGFYLSVVTAMVGIMVIGKDVSLLTHQDRVLPVLVPVIAFLICRQWRAAIKAYSGIFRAKFTVLRSMETRLPHKIFAEEDDAMVAQKSERLLGIDVFVPVALMAAFAVIFLYQLVSLGYLLSSR